MRVAIGIAAIALFVTSGRATVELRGQGGRADVPYKLVEWPAAAVSAAGFAAPWNLIQASSVAISPRGTVLVLHRGAHPVLEFDSAGAFIRSWGDGLISEGKVAGIPKNNWAPDRSRYSAVYGPAGCTACGAHSVRVDPQGNTWIVDAAAHVLYKFGPDGREVLRLGTKGTAGATKTTFNLPTDIAFAANGDLYVSDGYGGARVVKFSREGKYLLEWGKRGTGPGEFGLPHSVVVDAQGQVYVSDRDNQRIQIFDAGGTFLREWSGTGGVSGMAITGDRRRIVTGSVVRDLDGNVVAKLPEAGGAHGAAVDAAGNIYLAQLTGIVQKYVRATQ